MPTLNPTEESHATPRMAHVQCPKCAKKFKVPVSSILGSIVTPKKTAAAIKNGAKGGRPTGPSLTELRKRMADIKAGRVTVTPNERASLGRLIRRRKEGKK